MLVYVKSKTGNWLMPTNACNARLLLKAGKAKVIKRTPFSIQLLYDTTEYIQDITVGIDDGGKYVGVAAVVSNKVLYQEEITLRDDIKRKMDTRRIYRRGRRNRKTRYRQARFLNRTKPKGWIPPSIKAKKDAIVRTVMKIPLPAPILIRLEDTYFDFQAMENPYITGKQYQQGPILYEKNYKSAAKTRDGNKCRVCKAEKDLVVHHIIYKYNRGTDKLSNLMTLCESCHRKHHQEGLRLPTQKSGLYVYAAHVQSGKNYLQAELRLITKLQTTFGYITSYFRKKAGLAKSHVNDAVIIAKDSKSLCWFIKTKFVEFRKRSLHEATARKGRKTPNIIQKRNTKNTFRSKGFQRWDTVKVFGKLGFISGFTGNACRVVDIDAQYINKAGKSYNQVNLPEVKKIHNNQGRIKQLVCS